MARKATSASTSAFLEHLRTLYESEGPFATTYVVVPPPSEDANRQVEIEWKQARHQLERAGAPAAALDALDVAVDERDREGGTLCAVSTAAGLLLAIPMRAVVDRTVATWDSLPRFVPLVTWIQSMVPHLIVTTDRLGADIAAVRFDRLQHAETVEGDDLHIHRHRQGGWSHRRFQQRAENQWEDNARDVADEVAELAERIGAELIVVAGDVRARQFLREHLPQRWAGAVREVEGGRDEPSAATIAEQAVRLEATVAAEHTVAALEAFREVDGTGYTCTGVDQTLAALAERRVDRLLVADQSASLDEPEAPRAWFGADDPALVAATPDIVQDTGREAVEAPLFDAAIRAALAGGSEIRIVPGHTLSAPLAATTRFAE